jgi:hypothetical protein
VEPGVCRCDHGFAGDGLTCSPVVPKPLKLQPTSCPFRDCILNITFENPQDVAYTGYCHFNHKIAVQVDKVESFAMICRVPPLDPGKVYVSLSFDQEHQSEISLPLKIQTEPWDQESMIVGVLLFAVTFGIGMALVKKMKGRNLQRVVRQESLVARVAAKRGFL